MYSLRARLERLGRSIPALARGVDRVFHRHRHPTLDLDAITADDLDEADYEPLPAYRRWAIDALRPPPAYAERPAGPPPSYAETVRHDLFGTAAASNQRRRVTFDIDAKPRRRRRCRPCAARCPLCAGVVGRQQRMPTPSPSQQQQQDQERQQQRQEVLEPLLVPAQRAMLGRRLRVPPKIARAASTSWTGGATLGNGGVGGCGEGCLRDAC